MYCSVPVPEETHPQNKCAGGVVHVPAHSGNDFYYEQLPNDDNKHANNPNYQLLYLWGHWTFMPCRFRWVHYMVMFKCERVAEIINSG